MPTLILIAADTLLRFYFYSNNVATSQTTNIVMCAVQTCSTRSGRDNGVCMFLFPKPEANLVYQISEGKLHH